MTTTDYSAQDLTEADAPIPFALVNDPRDPGPAFAILLPNDALYREREARRDDPFGEQPTVWFAEAIAEGVRTAIAIELEELFGIDPDGPSALRVVRVQRGPDGIWRCPRPKGDDDYRPLDLDTELVSQWACGERAELTVDQAHQVMREHKDCAGMIPCRVRGRARAVLSRAGRMVLIDPSAAAHVWESLDWPDRRWSGGRIGGRALVHLAGKAA